MSRGALNSYSTVSFGPARPNDVEVSVVIATYNRGERLAELLNELCASPRNDFEIVVVDDGGETPALDAVKSANLDTIRVPLTMIRRANGGPGQARHTGIGASSGRVVVILDDDMHVPPTFLDAHLAAHRDADVVLGYIRSPHDESLPLFERFHLGSLERFVEEYSHGTAVAEGSRLCTGNVSFRRNAYDAVGGFDLSLQRCEDRDLGLRFEAHGFRFAFSKDAWSEHRTDHHSVSVWRIRSRLFGTLDARIAAKHPTLPSASPWSFLPKLPTVTRPVLIVSAIAPALGESIGALAYRLGVFLDSRGRRTIAMNAASMCYALDYYAGVGRSYRSRRITAVIRSLRGFRRNAASRHSGLSRPSVGAEVRP